jgi:GMP synthase-like glutamine amidotransferase
MASPRNLVLYVDIEHRHLRDREAAAQEQHARVVSELAGRVVPGATARRVWYGDLSEQALAAPEVLALVLSGNCSEWSWYDDPTALDGQTVVGPTEPLEPLKAILRTTRLPIVAFCGGHQLVAKAMAPSSPTSASDGDIVDHVDFVRKGLDRETEFNVTATMQLTEAGFADPIFTGLVTPPSPRFRLFHHDEVVRLPPGAVCLAQTAFTDFQALRYDAPARCVYTCQFHPEQDEPGSADGGTFLCNFFAAAVDHWDRQ